MASEQGNRSREERRTRGSAEDRGRAGIAREGERLIGTGSRIASHWLGAQKTMIAERLHEAALGLRDMSGNLEDRPNLREYVNAAADGIETLSEEVDRRDLRALARSAENAIRRQPLVVFTGLFAAGILVSRMLRSEALLTSETGTGE